MKLLMENWRKFITESHSKEHEEELEEIAGELEKASEMHAGQAKRVRAILDETDDEELEEGKKKNCGCGQDPCITYGIQEARAGDKDPGEVPSRSKRSMKNDALVEDEDETLEEGDGLWANIDAKKKRIKAGSGEKKAKPGDEDYPETLDIEEELDEKIDKDSMPCNKPRRTSSHKGKSHVVKACENGKEKIIPFGEKGASTAGKPKKGESDKMKAKRKSFKARHAKNIKKGKMSAAYWADKEKW